MKIYKSIILFLTYLIFLSFNCQREENPLKPESDTILRIYISDYIPDWSDPMVPPPAVPPLNELNLIEEPFLTNADITNYKWSTHYITFPISVHNKLKNWGNLLHRIFVVVAEGERIYWGKFMDDLDSGICQNPVIRLLTRHPDGRNTIPEFLIIERAYPGYSGSQNDPDIRNDLRIYNALKKACILLE
jgi:hypothetical protein